MNIDLNALLTNEDIDPRQVLVMQAGLPARLCGRGDGTICATQAPSGHAGGPHRIVEREEAIAAIDAYREPAQSRNPNFD
jgi:hypothetical protein